MTAAWMGVEDERKYNKEAVEALLRARLLALAELDNHLSKVCTVAMSLLIVHAHAPLRSMLVQHADPPFCVLEVLALL